ncbi:MAG: hypothetical protein LBB98_00455 [Treponema sp.]|jgi:galactoside O-acetyltransferase|nr:hypothetical protein [Treponema sp.]
MRHKQRKEKGLVYHYDDSEIMGEQLNYMEKLYDYNNTRPLEQDRARQEAATIKRNVCGDWR